MRAGTLRKVGWVQQRGQARDSMGGLPSSWMDVMKIRYQFQTLSSHAVDSAGNIRATATSRITMRWRDGIQPGMRIRAEETDVEPQRFFNITAVNNVDQRHHQLERSEDHTSELQS